MARLNEIERFGATDADNDDLLLECFEGHEAYKDALEFKKFLIVGRKGAGKTSIYKKILLTRSHDLMHHGHNFRSYPWQYHSHQKVIGVPDEECFIESWKYLILLTLAKVVLNNDNSQPWSDDSAETLSSIESFVVDTYGTRNPDVTNVFHPRTELRLKPTLGLAWDAIKLGLSAEKISIDQLPKIFPEVNNNLLDKISTSINPELKYYVLFDELDLGFKPDDAEYKYRIIGLIRAARDINLFMKEKGKKCSTLIFLRDDIYSLLSFEDKNKITENNVSRIEWDSARTKHTLKSLMSKRISKLLSVPEEDAWGAVFNENREMTGHQTKYQHILDRTFQRPRDIIKFCNEALNHYKARSDGENSDLIDNEDINAARDIYSGYLLEELTDEMHKHDEHFETFIEVLRNLQSMQFDYSDFCEAAQSVMGHSYAEDRALDGLRFLFEFSVIGYYRTGLIGGGSTYVYKYNDPRAQPNLKIAKFKVHMGLKEVLGLKKFIRGA